MKAIEVICAELDEVSEEERGEIIEQLLETYTPDAVLCTGERLDFLNRMHRRVVEMSEIPCVKDRREMRCFPKDHCSFCRAREVLGPSQAEGEWSSDLRVLASTTLLSEEGAASMTNPPYVCHADDYSETRGLVPCGDCTACSMNGVWRAGHAAGAAEVAALSEKLAAAEARLREAEAEIAKLRGDAGKGGGE